MRTQLFNAFKISTLAVVLSSGLSYVYAWTAPASQPPNGNVSAPINTSSTAQTKTGSLNLATVSGGVGIGMPASSPNYKLEVKGGGFSIAPSAGSGSYALDWPNGNGSARFRMWDQFGTQGVYVASDHNSFFKGGKVSIGTDVAAQTLTVAGDIGATGNIKSSGTVCDGSNNCIGAGNTLNTGVVGSLCESGNYCRNPAGVKVLCFLSTNGTYPVITITPSWNGVNYVIASGPATGGVCSYGVLWLN